jgi:hypothetical protein
MKENGKTRESVNSTAAKLIKVEIREWSLPLASILMNKIIPA